MQIKAQVQVYRVDQTKKGAWVQCRALVTIDGEIFQATVLRETKDALDKGVHLGTFTVREREGNLALELAAIAPYEAARKAA